ncbi:biosynthetic arginine decarboxylase [Hydrogenimonas cancrithermarum]|uniref:Arginine decarboxylase n=1 Tax=Hydrogenimonas cancrithermarum TaxID=2993563 RepID=A0ABN6WTI4_9BACT|nr:biosynthetic arginine decarboxylase [Hydrogenimonas cancrithermarum]BDY12188.1 arginine decarboxylase [Hydrogenimonas cancrithermarum]
MPSTNLTDPRRSYGIHLWGEENFIVEEGVIKVNHGRKPSLVELTRTMREEGYKGPLFFRFPHLAAQNVRMLFDHFERAKREFAYQGKFKAVFPLKVNQFPGFVIPLMEATSDLEYGLEAGSKAELILAMTYTNLGKPITVNGFKDREMISIGFLAAKMGHNITLTIEGINELELIIKEAKRLGSPMPKIGLRIRLHTGGIGIWAKSGGYGSKFGLTSTELLEAMELLKKHGLTERLSMIHFHIGSQMNHISPLKKAIREAGNIYAELRKMGADNLHAINIGGGLAVEYSQQEGRSSRNYTIEEFTNDVVFLLKEIADAKGVREPTIFTESGRYVAANHAVLVAPVLELFSQEYSEKTLHLKEKNPPLVQELYDLYRSISTKNAREYLHDALDHMESLLTLFDLGYIDLTDRANTETLVHLIIKKALGLLRSKPSQEIKAILDRVQERYLVNFSLFQSLPDYWGLGQNFPVMPLDRLDQAPTRSASLWDITCDSDGEIAFNIDNPLYLHDVDVETEEYFLGFFKVGAYQEILGMRHNLFTHPTEATIIFDAEGDYTIENIIEAQNILDVLDDIDYDTREIERRIRQMIEEAEALDDDERKEILGELYLYLSENGYLRTINFSEGA